MPQAFDGLALLTPLAGVTVATGTDFFSATIRRPFWAKWGSLWVETSGEVATASLVPEIQQYPQGDVPGAVAPLMWQNVAAISANGTFYDALGPLSTENWVVLGWRSQTVIPPPPVFRVRFRVTGAGASFLVKAAMDWFNSA